MPLTVQVTTTLVTTPCPTCWGQGRIGHDPDGEGYRLYTCATCLGVCEITRVETSLTPSDQEPAT